MIVSEGGINWTWFTEYTPLSGQRVKILARYRLYNADYAKWPKKCQGAKKHPEYYHELIWKEQKEDRIATKYNVPDVGWCQIVNPRNLFAQ